MKKILLFFLILTSLSYSAQETLSIDEALDRVGNDRGSYEFKKFQNSQEGTNIKIKDNKLGDFNGVTLSSGYNISENNLEDRPRKYDRTFQNKATYGPFFVNYNYVQSERSYVSFGAGIFIILLSLFSWKIVSFVLARFSAPRKYTRVVGWRLMGALVTYALLVEASNLFHYFDLSDAALATLENILSAVCSLFVSGIFAGVFCLVGGVWTDLCLASSNF